MRTLFVQFAGLALWIAAAWSQQPPAAETMLRHAIELHQAGDAAGAIPEYRAYLQQVPGNAMARSNLGAALSHMGQYEEAIVEYKTALESQPGNLPVRLNLALAYYKTMEIAQAASELERVVAEKPSDRQALFLLADCELRLGENTKVIGLLSPLEAQPVDDKALDYLLGTALIRDDQTARGQLLVDRILRYGDSAEARVLMGTAKLGARDYSSALEDFKKAVELNPRLPDVLSLIHI